MKKEYIKPEIEISLFDTEDVITTSAVTPTPSGLSQKDSYTINGSGAVDVDYSELQ